MELKSKQ